MLATDSRDLRQGMERRGLEEVTLDQNSTGGGSDEVLNALNELENGKDWKSILAAEDDPGTVQLVSSVLRRQSEASGYLRRSLVVALRAEGQSIPSIANLFGVTHQRVSNLLRRVAQSSPAASDS